MNTIFKIFKQDLKNIAKSKMAMLVVFGIIFIPGIYAWLNIDSNWSPYDNTGNIPIAIVNEDEGATIISQQVNVGAQIEKSLEQNNAMKWTITDQEDAMQGVERSSYYGAIIIPNDFSQRLTTIFDSKEPEKPTFDFYVNNKKNPVAPIIVSKAANTIKDSANQAFVNTLVYKVVDTVEDLGLITKGENATTGLISKLEATSNQVEQLKTTIRTASLAADATNQSISAISSIIPTLENLNNSAIQRLNGVENNLGAIDSTVDLSSLQSLLDRLSSQIAEIEAIQATLDQALPAFEGLNKLKADLQANIDNLSAARTEYQNAVKSKLDTASQMTNNTLNNTTEMMQTMNSSLESIKQSMGYLGQALSSASSLGGNVESLLSGFQADLATAISGLKSIRDSEIYQSVLSLLENEPDVIADFIATPVESNQIEVYPISSYGSEMAPFYSVLACWVGCTILVAIVKIDVKKTRLTAKAKNYQKFFGRFMLFGSIALLQGLAIGVGDLIMQVQTINWPLFLITLMLSSFTFSLIIYSLGAAFGKVGQALSIVILVLQVAGSGGTFPIELLPRPFQILQPFMPFYPALNATRETIGGFYQNDYQIYLLMLSAHFVVALCFGLVFSKYTFVAKSRFQKSLESTKVIG